MILVLKIWKTESNGFPLISSPSTKFKPPIKPVSHSATVLPQSPLAWRSFTILLPPLLHTVTPITDASVNLPRIHRFMHAWPSTRFWFSLFFCARFFFFFNFLWVYSGLSRRFFTGLRRFRAVVVMLMIPVNAELETAGPVAHRFIGFSAWTRSRPRLTQMYYSFFAFCYELSFSGF